MEIFNKIFLVVFLIPITAIIMDGVKSMYRTRLKHIENIERLRRGYPPADLAGKDIKHNDLVDMTHSGGSNN